MKRTKAQTHSHKAPEPIQISWASKIPPALVEKTFDAQGYKNFGFTVSFPGHHQMIPANMDTVRQLQNTQVVAWR